MSEEERVVTEQADVSEDGSRACRVCGCTDQQACVDALGEPCRWVEDELCSRCSSPAGLVALAAWIDAQQAEARVPSERLTGDEVREEIRRRLVPLEPAPAAVPVDGQGPDLPSVQACLDALLESSGGNSAEELVAADLACWCPLDQPCHADVLLRVAAGADPQEVAGG